MKPLGKSDILREGVDVRIILFVTGDLLGSVLVLESALDVCMKTFVLKKIKMAVKRHLPALYTRWRDSRGFWTLRDVIVRRFWQYLALSGQLFQQLPEDATKHLEYSIKMAGVSNYILQLQSTSLCTRRHPC
jgi:hypothetical protein